MLLLLFDHALPGFGAFPAVLAAAEDIPADDYLAADFVVKARIDNRIHAAQHVPLKRHVRHERACGRVERPLGGRDIGAGGTNGRIVFEGDVERIVPGGGQFRQAAREA